MKSRRKSVKKFNVITDSEGDITLPDELARRYEIGDDYAFWKYGDGWCVVFPRSKRSMMKIPKHAQWGKVQPALPEFLVALPVAKTRRKK